MSLPVPLGWLCLAAVDVTAWGSGALRPGPKSPESLAPLHAGRGESWEEWGVIRFLGAATVGCIDGGVMGASAAGEMVSGPTSTAAGHPRLASGQKVMGTTSPPAAGFFEAVGSAATPGGPGSRANLHSLPVQPPLCAPVHLSLDVWMCGILQHPGMLGRATSVELWILY